MFNFTIHSPSDKKDGLWDRKKRNDSTFKLF
jgi:hypothetical protein